MQRGELSRPVRVNKTNYLIFRSFFDVEFLAFPEIDGCNQPLKDNRLSLSVSSGLQTVNFGVNRSPDGSKGQIDSRGCLLNIGYDSNRKEGVNSRNGFLKEARRGRAYSCGT